MLVTCWKVSVGRTLMVERSAVTVCADTIEDQVRTAPTIPRIVEWVDLSIAAPRWPTHVERWAGPWRTPVKGGVEGMQRYGRRRENAARPRSVQRRTPLGRRWSHQ